VRSEAAFTLTAMDHVYDSYCISHFMCVNERRTDINQKFKKKQKTGVSSAIAKTECNRTIVPIIAALGAVDLATTSADTVGVGDERLGHQRCEKITCESTVRRKLLYLYGNRVTVGFRR
jgi:hypothetical protein